MFLAVPVLLPGAAASAQGLVLAELSVTATNPSDDGRSRSVTIEPTVEALGGTALDPLLPAQLEIVTVGADGSVESTTRLLTPLTDPDLLRATLTVARAPGLLVEETFADDIVSATAQAFLLDPELELIAASEPLQLLPRLSVVIPTGGGTVAASPARLSCRDRCDAPFVLGSDVTLTAIPDPGFELEGWTGPCSGADLTCVVTMSGAASVEAHFAAPPPPRFHGLAVEVEGPSGPRVTSSDATIDCPGLCTADLEAGSVVQLTAVPGAGASFTGWAGDCRGVTGPTCVVTMDADRRVIAGFDAKGPVNPVRRRLEVSLVDAMPGERVTSTPPGIDCPGDCGESFDEGVAVKLFVHTAKAGRGVDHWSEGCRGRARVCAFTMSVDRAISVTLASRDRPQPPDPIVEPPQGPEVEKVVPDCSTSRTCTATPYELIASFPSWPVLLLSVLVLLLVAVPSTMFDSTLEAKYDAVDRRYRAVARFFGRDPGEEWWMRTPPRRAAALLGLCSLAVVLVYRLAGGAPGAGIVGEAAWLVGGMIAFLAVTFVAEWPEARRAKAAGRVGRIRPKGATIVIAVVCAVVSAKLRLDPGYTYGIIAGYTGSKLHQRAADAADAAADVTGPTGTRAGATAALWLTVVAWLVWWYAKDHGIDDDPTAVKLFVSSVLSFVVTAGFGRLAFSYLPIRYFDGAFVLGWSYTRWRNLEIGAFVVACLVFTYTKDGYIAEGMFDDPGPAITAGVVAIAFALVSFLVWNHFRRADADADAAAAPGADADDRDRPVVSSLGPT